MKALSGEQRDQLAAQQVSDVTALLHPAAQKADVSERQEVAFKAESFQDEDGVIIAVLSAGNLHDRENERALIFALKAATWELAMKGGPPHGFDLNHEDDTGADLVGVYYDYDNDRTVVHLRPHDPAIFDAAKAGEIVGLSWSGPYRLRPSA